MNPAQIASYRFARKAGTRALWAIKTAKGQATEASRIACFPPAWQSRGNARMK